MSLRAWSGLGRVLGLGLAVSAMSCGTSGRIGGDDPADADDFGPSTGGSSGMGGVTQPQANGGMPGAGGGGDTVEPAPDAGSTGPEPDAGSTEPNPDAGSTQPSPDAAVPVPDVALPTPDGAPPMVDAQVPPKLDTAAPEPEPDAAPVEEMDAMPGPEDSAPEPGGFEWGKPIGPEVPFGGTCNARMQAYNTEGNVHAKYCSRIRYQSNPPHSGNHYAAWAAYRTYSRPIPWGFLVHSLEHGAVVITYNCPSGCAEELTQVQAFIDALPIDCGAGVKRRVILMPEPTLPVKFAASAWRHVLKADCFDRAAFQRFFTERYNKGREDSCNQGSDPSNGDPQCGL